MISLVFETRPIPWSRTLRGEKSKRKKRQDAYINSLAIMLKTTAEGETFDGPVFVRVEFDYKKGQTQIQIMGVERYNLKTTRADLDNLIKIVLEALQKSGIVKDDAQVAIIEAEKTE